MIVTLTLLGLGAYAGYYDTEYQRLSRALDADLGAFRRLRWEPPALRGTPGEGNAAAEAYAALAGFGELPQDIREALAARIYYGQPLAEAESAVVRKHWTLLDNLRAATRNAMARTDLVPERGVRMHVPCYPCIVDAAMLLLSQAGLAAPDECLRIAADTIRLGQDLVPGAPLEAASVSMRITSISVPVITRCASKADPATLRKAAHELHILATHAPPTGAGIELADIVTAMKLRERAALANKSNPVLVVQTVRERAMLLHTWSLYTDPTRFRKLVPANYPDALDEWKREQDSRTQSRQPYVAEDAGGVLDFLYDDMRGQALLRGLAVGIATLAERAYRGKLPTEPVGLREAALCDPFRGKALGFRIAADGHELSIWSVGEDLRDDNGSDEWGPSAPTDVTLHFPLEAPSEPVAKRTRKIE